MLNRYIRPNQRNKPQRPFIVDKHHKLSKGLVAWWLANEGAGSIITDISGNEHDGAFNNMAPGTAWGHSIFGHNIIFDGSNDRVTAGDWHVSTGDFSVSFLMIPNALPTSENNYWGVVGRWDIDSKRGWGVDFRIIGANIELQFLIDSVGNWQEGNRSSCKSDITKITFFTGNIYRVACTYTQSTKATKMYINNADVTVEVSSDATSISDHSGVIVTLGAQYNAGTAQRFFNGLLDDVRIYDRAFTKSDVEQLYYAPYENLIPLLPLRIITAAGGAVTIQPSALALTLTLNAPSIKTSILIQPSALTLTTTLHAPSLIISGAIVTVTPTVQTLSLTLGTPTIKINIVPQPSTLTLSTTLHAPSLVIGGAPVTISPSVQTLSLTLGTPSISTAGKVIPSSQALSLTFNAPTIKTNVVIQPSTLTMTATLGTPTVSTATSIFPSAQALVLSLGTPTIIIGAKLISPSVLPLNTTLLAPTIFTVGSGLVTPGSQSLTLTLQAPTVTIPGTTTLTAQDIENVAAAVWDKLVADHQNNASFGEAVQKLVNWAILNYLE